jgi:hypothetical protein
MCPPTTFIALSGMHHSWLLKVSNRLVASYIYTIAWKSFHLCCGIGYWGLAREGPRNAGWWFVHSACGFACFVLGYTHQARQGLVVVQILQWRQQQVRIYSRNDKSTRRKWWKYCRVSTCSRKRYISSLALLESVSAGTHIQVALACLIPARGLCSYARWLQ